MAELANSSIQVASTLIPLHGYNILIPNTCIDEVFKPSRITSIEQSPAWYAGYSELKGNRIHLLLLENIDRDTRVLSVEASLAVKLKKPSEFNDFPDIALLTAGTPTTLLANNYILDKEYRPTYAHPLALCYINIKEKQSLIPDIPRLYREYASQL